MPTYLITGATSGLGLQVALRLAAWADCRLVLPARDPQRAQAAADALLAAGARAVETPALDLASLASVRAFVEGCAARSGEPIDGLLMNAGVQSAQQLDFTADGFESTFAVNHLAHHLLLTGLRPLLAEQAIVGWTASGTHDPRETAARLSGFRGGRYTTAARLAHGDLGEVPSPAQACRDAYATSKLCNIVSARAFATSARPGLHFFSFDPGLMPGTGLARQHGAAAQWVWRHVLPRLAALLPGTSTTGRSGAILAGLLTGDVRGHANGSYFDRSGHAVAPAAPAADPAVATDLMDGSADLLRHGSIAAHTARATTPAAGAAPWLAPAALRGDSRPHATS